MGRIKKEDSHNYRFSVLEKEYFELRERNNKVGSDKKLGEMYLLCVEVATNYIKNYCRKCNINLSDLKSKSHDAATYCIMQYLKHPQFKIKKISSYAYFGFQRAIFGDSKQEMHEISLDELEEKMLQRDKTNFIRR
jgi:hypothetical protein